MSENEKIIKRVNIETVLAKVDLKLSPCPRCGGALSFYLDCPFSDGNIINPEICTEKCNVPCEALVYCEECDFETFVELVPKSGLEVHERRIKEQDSY
ncbi:MAG: hypothetical protein EU547_05000 [Promethearchaeota archaeon]|nr:MAG: hypothetical protein EU547_05000 [Candidatus Lokiarchaeota archaeon]